MIDAGCAIARRLRRKFAHAAKALPTERRPKRIGPPPNDDYLRCDAGLPPRKAAPKHWRDY
jgi:hypothetical protein